jgi:hypothetical protein
MLMRLITMHRGVIRKIMGIIIVIVIAIMEKVFVIES